MRHLEHAAPAASATTEQPSGGEPATISAALSAFADGPRNDARVAVLVHRVRARERFDATQGERARWDDALKTEVARFDGLAEMCEHKSDAYEMYAAQAAAIENVRARLARLAARSTTEQPASPIKIAERVMDEASVPVDSHLRHELRGLIADAIADERWFSLQRAVPASPERTEEEKARLRGLVEEYGRATRNHEGAARMTISMGEEAAAFDKLKVARRALLDAMGVK